MKSLFLVNVLLALAWGAVTGAFTVQNLLFGFIIGALALIVIRNQVGTTGYLRRTRRIASLVWLFVYELVLSGVRVARIVLSPGTMPLNPAMIAVPLTVTRDAEIALLANLITLTPGTLSVDVSDDRKTLYVHALDAADPDALRREIATGFEARIKEAFE